MKGNEEVVKLVNISKRYYLSSSVYVDALINVNLSIRRGEIAIVMGLAAVVRPR